MTYKCEWKFILSAPTRFSLEFWCPQHSSIEIALRGALLTPSLNLLKHLKLWRPCLKKNDNIFDIRQLNRFGVGLGFVRRQKDPYISTTLIIPITERGLILHVENQQKWYQICLRYEISVIKRSRKHCSPQHDSLNDYSLHQHSPKV